MRCPSNLFVFQKVISNMKYVTKTGNENSALKQNRQPYAVLQDKLFDLYLHAHLIRLGTHKQSYAALGFRITKFSGYQT